MADRARELIRQTCQMGEVLIVRGAVAADHVRMLVAAPPRLSPSKLVQHVKGRSPRRLQEEFPHLRKKYWGRHLGARRYFRATVGAVDEKTVREYLESQKWDEEVEGFKVTVPDSP